MKVGDKVKFRCFDGSIIDITVTSIDKHHVYGTSDCGSHHWANKKDVISKKDRERERKWKRFKEYCIMSKELEELENKDDELV